MGRVAGKVAIVTGGASGMGKADAILLAQEGAAVVVADLNETDGKAVAESIGDKARFMRLDVTDEDDWRSVIAATVAEFGRLDILVNNAGLLTAASVVDTDLAMFRKVQAVNSEGVFLGCKHAIPAMEQSGGGSIVNMSSVAAMQGVSFAAAYSASKGAVRSLTKSVAMYCKEKGNRIRCNSVHPDGVRTPMVAKLATGKEAVSAEDLASLQGNNMCNPEDVAHMVLYLAADESWFVNGAEMLIDNCATITPPLGLS